MIQKFLEVVADPFFIAFVIVPFVGAVVGWVGTKVAWPALVEAVGRKPLAEAKAADARVDALRSELLAEIRGVDGQLATAEKRYDEEIDDLRDAWKRRWEP